jgi:hypothetical protein
VCVCVSLQPTIPHTRSDMTSTRAVGALDALLNSVKAMRDGRRVSTAGAVTSLASVRAV